jgi:hypothetical protein
MRAGRRSLMEEIFPPTPIRTALNCRAVMANRGMKSFFRELISSPEVRPQKRVLSTLP